MTKKAPEEITRELAHFTGTTQWYRYQPGILLTDGAKYLADEVGCYWLYDIIWSVMPEIRKDSFHVVHLVVYGDKSAIFKLEDGNGNVRYQQAIEHTDFPLPQINLYVCQQENEYVILLRSEY